MGLERESEAESMLRAGVDHQIRREQDEVGPSAHVTVSARSRAQYAAVTPQVDDFQFWEGTNGRSLLSRLLLETRCFPTFLFGRHFP